MNFNKHNLNIYLCCISGIVGLVTEADEKEKLPNQ